MDNDQLDNLWKTETPGGPNSNEVLKLVRRGRVRETRRRIRMGFFGFNLTLATALAIWVTASGKSRLTESWPAMVSLLTLWATYIEFIRFRMSESGRIELLSQDLRSVLRLTLQKANAASREIKTLLVVNLLTLIPMTIASVQNLLNSGKMTPPNAVSFTVFCAVIFGANIAFLSIHYFTGLRPECESLKKQLESLQK